MSLEKSKTQRNLVNLNDTYLYSNKKVEKVSLHGSAKNSSKINYLSTLQYCDVIDFSKEKIPKEYQSVNAKNVLSGIALSFTFFSDFVSTIDI